MTRASFFLFLGLTACNAQIAQVLASEDAGGAPTNGDAGAPIDGGVVEVDATTPGPDAGDQDGGPAGPIACNTDPDCNADAIVSTLWGSCFMGVCICKSGYVVQPNGKCGPGNPPACNTSGGTCRQNPATCNAGEMQGAYWATMTCGDVVPVVCCYDASQCKAPIDLVCCGASTTPYEPVCVNGWKTCDQGAPTPRLRGTGCQ